jgi:hypothetical protein
MSTINRENAMPLTATHIGTVRWLLNHPKVYRLSKPVSYVITPDKDIETDIEEPIMAEGDLYTTEYVLVSTGVDMVHGIESRAYACDRDGNVHEYDLFDDYKGRVDLHYSLTNDKDEVLREMGYEIGPPEIEYQPPVFRQKDMTEIDFQSLREEADMWNIRRETAIKDLRERVLGLLRQEGGT